MNEHEWGCCEHAGVMIRYLTREVHEAAGVAIGDHPRDVSLISQRQLRLLDDACFKRFGLNIDDLAVQAKPPAEVAAVLRCIVGNLWRPAKVWRTDSGLHPIRDGAIMLMENHLAPDALSLASAAYEQRQDDGSLDPPRLAVLADALEEAGCVGEICPACGPLVIDLDPLIRSSLPAYHCGECDLVTHRLPQPLLAHLRLLGPHVRGCWALDLILGKE